MSDPVLIAYSVQRRGGGKRSWWQRIGAAYPHEQGAGLTVVLDVLPLDGRVILLELDDSDERRLAARLSRRAKEYRRRGG